MDDRELIRATFASLRMRLRLTRALTAGARFLLVGLALALLPLLLKGLFPVGGPAMAAGLPVGLAALGVLYGLVARLPLSHVARLADSRLGLKERLVSAREHLGVPSEAAPDMLRAQLAETAARLRETQPERAFPFRFQAEARLLPPVAALALALALLPPLPLKWPGPPGESSPPQTEAGEEQTREKPLEQKLATPAVPDDMFPKVREREVQRGPLSPRDNRGDLAAVFRDTKMSQQRPDFGSFIKQGDERLKLLARPESIPDLSRDVTQSPYQMMIRRMQEQLRAGRMQGLSWEQIERLISELGQSGQRFGGGGMGEDLMSEMEAQGGSPDRMMDALARALSRLRDRDEAGRGRGRNLRQSPSRRGGSGQDRGEGDADRGEDGAPGGSLPGTGKSLQILGDPTDRIGGDKQDSFLEGDLREGQMEAYDTNLSGRGADNTSRLSYMDVFSEYRKLMEEALTKEPIPFNYREQVKDYFRALESR
jgi:hypothetical protein